MRKMTWIRTGLASVILAGGAGGIIAVGCGGDDTVTPPKDGGHDVTSNPDTGGSDSPVGDGCVTNCNPVDAGDGAVPQPHAKVILVHASPDAPPLRFCFGTGQAADGSDTAVTPLAALPHFGLPQQPFPGVFAGTGGPLPDITDLSKVAITGFAINAVKIAGENGDAATEKTCDQLVGAAGAGGTLTLNTDYFRLKTIPKGTFAPATTWVIAAIGCLPAAADPTASVSKCGSDYNANTGNFSAALYQLDRTVADATKMGVQIIHAASALDGFFASQQIPTGDSGTDAGTFGPVKELIGFAAPDAAPLGLPVTDIQYPQFLPVPAAPQPGAVASNPSNLLYVATHPAASQATILNKFALPLNIIALLSNGTGLAADGGPYIANGENYAFILMGDPTAAQLGTDAGYDGHGVHLIAFPSNPALPKFQ